MSSVAFARNGLNGFAGKSQVEHLYLYAKDLNTWNPIPDGAYGKAVFNWKHSDVAFEGFGLAPETDYTLIFYGEPATNGWNNRKIEVISSGTSDSEGYLELGRVDIEITAETPFFGDAPGVYKVWLVPSAAIDGSGFLQWVTPEMFLFESRELIHAIAE